MLESMVFNELIYSDYSINVGVFEKNEKDKNGKSIRKCYEIDFIAKKGAKKFYIQVSNDISSSNTKAREIRPFVALNDSFQKIIVVNKPLEETMDKNGFITIGVSNFLLKFIK